MADYRGMKAAGLINIDNIQLWAGLRGGGLADVDKVQLWLVPAK